MLTTRNTELVCILAALTSKERLRLLLARRELVALPEGPGQRYRRPIYTRDCVLRRPSPGSAGPFALPGPSVGQRGILRPIHLLPCTYNTSHVRILMLFNIFPHPSRSPASSCLLPLRHVQLTQQPENQPTTPNDMHPIAPQRRPFRPHFTYLYRLVLTRSREPE
jgi:hypothetical protein